MAKAKTVTNQVPTEQIPEALRFETVKSQLEAFKAANPAFFDYLVPLVEEYNNSLEAAEKAVRAQGVSCSDFILKNFTTKFNAEALYEWAGSPEKFLELGGTLSTVQVRGCDKSRVTTSVNSGRIPGDVAAEVMKKTPTYSKPDKVTLP
jgi:hypothetical protein